MATNQKFKEYRVTELPTENLKAGDKHHLDVGRGKYKTYIVSDALVLTSDSGEEFIEKDTMQELRDISAREIWAIQQGIYKGVKLNGYYAKGDAPILNYYISDTSDDDDGGSTIVVNDLKLQIHIGKVNLKNFGAKSDGNEITFTGTDNKSYIDKAILYCSKYKQPLIIDGKYCTNPIRIDVNNVSIEMIKDSYLIGFTTMGLQDKFIGIGGSNISIEGTGSFIKCPSKDSGEWNHAIQIDTGKNITIHGLKTIGSGGDGIYIGSTTENRPTNINLIDVKTDNARRNGISLINGVNINIIRPLCEGAKGTYPMAGIDIEPNSLATERLEGIYIDSPITRDNGGYGVLVTTGTYTANAEKNLDITIVNHTSIRDGQDGLRGGLGIIGTGHTNPWGFKCNGIVKYNGQIFESGGSGFSFHSQDPSFAPLFEVDVYIQDCATKQSSNNIYKSGVLIYGGVGDVNFPNGNLKLNVKVRDTREVPLTFTDIYIYNTAQDIENIDIIADVDSRTTFGSPLVCSSKNFKGSLKYHNTVKEITGTTSSGTVANLLGVTTILKNNITLNLPLSSRVLGHTLTFINGDTSYKNIRLEVGDTWDIINKVNTQDIILNINQTIKLKATTLGWNIVESNDQIRQQFTNSARPPKITYLSTIPIDGTWVKGDIVYNLNVVDGQNMGWQCQVAGSPGTWKPFGIINLGNATVSVKGIINQSAVSADVATAPSATYTQTEVQAILTELRDLKTKLRIAGILAT